MGSSGSVSRWQIICCKTAWAASGGEAGALCGGRFVAFSSIVDAKVWGAQPPRPLLVVGSSVVIQRLINGTFELVMQRLKNVVIQRP